LHRKYGCPLLVTEFGADTIAGEHALPATAFSEEYQREFLAEYFAGIDSCPFVVGEQLWNFADFMTSQSVMRPGGNRKGVFTRDRKPKSVVSDIRFRWTGLQASAYPKSVR
jgi:beta-glucuronidase